MSNTGHQIKVYIVDNASEPADVETLLQLEITHPNVYVIANTENVGYFAGLNIGLNAARLSEPEINWVVIGNNDLEFPPDFCDCIERQQVEYSFYSVVSPDIVTLDGHHQNPHVISKISVIREIFYDIYYSNYYLSLLVYKATRLVPRLSRRGDEDKWQTAQPIYQGYGACYLLTPKFFAQFQQLWAPTFMMHEEFFLSQQLNKVGEQVFYSPAISVTHHWHGSLQNIPSKRRWLMARAAHTEYRKYVKVSQRLKPLK